MNTLIVKNYLKVEAFIVLIFIFQYFFYIKDLTTLYYLQKLIIPILLSLVAIFILFKSRNNESEKHIFYIFLGYCCLLTLSALGSTIHFDQPIISSLIAEGKLISASYIFLGYYYFKIRKITEQELLNISVILFWITIFVYLYLHYSIDPAKYWYEESQLFILDSKGYRMRLPVQLITLVSFYALASLKKSKLNIIIYLTTLLYLTMLHAQRYYLFAFILTSLIIIIMQYYKKYWKSVVFLGLPIIIFISLQSSELVGYLLKVDSIAIRGDRFFVIQNYLEKANLYNFIFGVGEINENWQLKEYLLGSKFSASDYGFLGIIYEYGIAGLIFFISFYFYALSSFKRMKGEFLIGLKFYLIFTFVLTLLSPYLFYYAGLLCGMMGIYNNYRVKAPSHEC